MKANQSILLHKKLRQERNQQVFYKVVIFLLFLFVFTDLSAQRTYTWTGGTSTAWNNTNNWTKAPAGGTFPGDGAANDIVVIPAGTNQPLLNVTLANPVQTVTFTSTNTTTLTITGVTLTVTGAVVINHANANRSITIAGTGTLTCASLTVGGTGVTLSQTRTLTFTSTLENLDIAGSFTLQAYRNSGFSGNVAIVHNDGTISTSGLVTTLSGTGGPPTGNYSMGNTFDPRLNLEGATPLSFSAGVTSTIDFVGGTGTIVDYQSSSSFTIPATPAGVNTYTSLYISGGGGAVKTFSANLSVAASLLVRAATTLAMGTFTVGGTMTDGITLETVGGGNGASITGTTGLITLGGGITVNYTGTGSISTGASITKILSLANVVRTFTVNDDGDEATTDFTISSVISSSGTTGGITKAGDGTLALTGANTFDGAVTINAGVLAANTLANAATVSSLGDGAGTPAITIGASGTLRYTGTGHSTTRTITLTGSGATLDASGSGTATFAGAMSGGFNLVLTGTGTGIYSAIIGTGVGTVTKNGSGTWTLSAANSYQGGCTMNAGTLNINNASALGTVAGTFTIAGGIIQNTSAGAITTNNHPINLIGDFQHAGTQNLNLGTGAVSMATDININTSVSGRILTIQGAIDESTRSLTKSGIGTLNFANQTISLNALTISGGVLLASSGTMNFDGAFTNNATFTNNSGTVVMNGVGSSIAGSTTTTFNNLTIASTPTAQSQYNIGFNVAGALTVNGGVTFAPTGGTITMNNAASSISNSGTLTFNNITVSVTPGNQSQYNTSFSVGGTFATTGATTFAPTGGTITMSGVSGAINASGTGSLTFSSLDITGTTISSTGNFAVAVTMTVSSTFAPAATSIISGAGTLTGTGTVRVTRTAATPSFGAQYTITTKTLANLTVNYIGAGAQTVDAQNYGNLTISTNGTRTVTFVNGGTVRVSGVFTPTATTTTYVVTNNTFEFNGSGAQTITAFTYNNLIISNAGAKTVLAGTTVNCQTLEINDTAVLTLPDTSVLNVQG